VDDEGRIVIATYPDRAKIRNARRDNRVSVLVMSPGWTDPWVQVDGEAEVLDLPEALGAVGRLLPGHLRRTALTGTNYVRP